MPTSLTASQESDPMYLLHLLGISNKCIIYGCTISATFSVYTAIDFNDVNLHSYGSFQCNPLVWAPEVFGDCFSAQYGFSVRSADTTQRPWRSCLQLPQPVSVMLNPMACAALDHIALSISAVANSFPDYFIQPVTHSLTWAVIWTGW